MSGASQPYSEPPSHPEIDSPALTCSTTSATHRVEADPFDGLEAPPITAADAFGSLFTGDPNNGSSQWQDTQSAESSSKKVSSDCGLKSALKPNRRCNPWQSIESRALPGSLYRNQDILSKECPDRESWDASNLSWDGRHSKVERKKMRLKTEGQYMEWLGDMGFGVDSDPSRSTLEFRE